MKKEFTTEKIKNLLEYYKDENTLDRDNTPTILIVEVLIKICNELENIANKIYE